MCIHLAFSILKLCSVQCWTKKLLSLDTLYRLNAFFDYPCTGPEHQPPANQHLAMKMPHQQSLRRGSDIINHLFADPASCSTKEQTHKFQTVSNNVNLVVYTIYVVQDVKLRKRRTRFIRCPPFSSNQQLGYLQNCPIQTLSS